MTTALLTHADCLTHITPEGHPERVARLEHVLHALEDLDLKRVTAPMAAKMICCGSTPRAILNNCALTCPIRASCKSILTPICRPARSMRPFAQQALRCARLIWF